MHKQNRTSVKDRLKEQLIVVLQVFMAYALNNTNMHNKNQFVSIKYIRKICFLILILRLSEY